MKPTNILVLNVKRPVKAETKVRKLALPPAPEQRAARRPIVGRSYDWSQHRL